MAAKGTKVKALRHHTFAGQEYHEGDTYTVKDDDAQSAEQYLMTLGALQFAIPEDEAVEKEKAVAAEEKAQAKAKKDGDYETKVMKAK